MRNLTPQYQVCLDYCTLPENENIKTYTLAKRIFEENPGMFPSIEMVRSKVRFIRGQKGNKHRKFAKAQKPLNYDTTNSPIQQVNSGAKILIFDIETAPILAYVWGIWNQNIGLNQISSDWFCLTWAAKWLFDEKVYHGKIKPKEVKEQDDKRIMQGLWELLNEADIVVTHNGDKFDIPRVNARFVINGMPPPLPYQSIDTLKTVKRQFGFTSNKLDYVNKLLKLTRKMETGGFELWENCMKGDQAAIDKMAEYNCQDVQILEETYLKLLPYIKPHPNIGLFILDETQARCPTCGSHEIEESGKIYATTANNYELIRCKNCKSVSRKRLSSTTIEQKRHLLMSTPR